MQFVSGFRGVLEVCPRRSNSNSLHLIPTQVEGLTLSIIHPKTVNPNSSQHD